MIAKTGMTIDTYLKQAGLKADAPAHRRQFIPLKGAAGQRFGDLIDAAASPAKKPDAGLARGATIVDYLDRRHPVVPTGPAGRNSAVVERPDPPRTAEPASGPSVQAVIDHSIGRAADKYRLPGRLIESVIQAESGFRPAAVSPAGAQGLMQLMPATARELGVVDPFDPAQNIDGGARYIRQMLDRFDGDLKLALAAYNAGPGTVERYNGQVPYPETKAYVERVLAGMAATEPSAG